MLSYQALGDSYTAIPLVVLKLRRYSACNFGYANEKFIKHLEHIRFCMFRTSEYPYI
jgi:hypothetical protein